MKRLLSNLLRLCAVAYPIGLCLVILLFRFVGERWWVATVGLYLPRIVFAIPLPILAAALLRWGPRRLLAPLGLALGLLVFPLLGFTWNTGAGEAEPSLRVLSFNVDSGREGNAAIVAQIEEAHPDLVLLQELAGDQAEFFRDYFKGYFVHASTQFFFASRFPIRDVELPEAIPLAEPRSPRFLRYTVETPLGLLDVLNVHPISPRPGFDSLRGGGVLVEAARGRLFTADERRELDDNTRLRQLQVEAIAARVARAEHPVIVAGDTNLPTLSWLFARELSGLEDGFEEAGEGLGYTFPATQGRPWMRIDRILADPRLRFLHFEVGADHASDHYCVFADLALREP